MFDYFWLLTEKNSKKAVIKNINIHTCNCMLAIFEQYLR